jgi:hypothetical protein
MKLVSTLALSAALAAGALAAPAAAQKAADAAQANGKAAAPGAQRKYNISKEARKAISELQTAVKAKAADVPAKLAAAQAVAKNNDDKYVIAKLQLEQALGADDKAAQRAAVAAILASGGADAAESATLNDYLAAAAMGSGNFAAAEATYAAQVAANPNDLNAIVRLAQAKVELKKESEALALLQRAIGLRTAAGQKAEESWYRNAVAIAHKQKNSALAGQLAQEALSAYPSDTNFNNLIAITQPLIAKDEEAFVDLLRLMQVRGQIKSSTDFLKLAQHHEYNRNWGEAKTVLEAAASAGKTSAAHTALLSRVNGRIAEDRAALPGAEAKARTDATGKLALNIASVYAGYKDYAKAADLYRVALQKGGVDANLVNTRLGIALAMAGQRPEAETAFRKVTGLRAPLANLWMAWLAQRV